MAKLITIFISNSPINCHIIKGRLETEGVTCYVYDEYLVWVYPFYAVAIGGVKLKVPSDKLLESKKIIDLTLQGKLLDDCGEYHIDESSFNNSKLIEYIDTAELLISERDFRELTKRKFKFSWKQFLYELFDFDRSVFSYLRTRPVEYYIEKEIVDNYTNTKKSRQITNCPICDSDNTSFGYAIDFKWDILYLILSLIIAPLYPIRKKHHCFECGHDFK